MENYFQMNLTKQDINAFSNLGLAHIGDGVYELLCRSYLCAKQEHTVGQLHKDTVQLVKAPTQAKLVEKILPLLTEEELAVYKRGRNAQVKSVPGHASRAQYGEATGLEALLGWLYLKGRKDRINELFCRMMEE